MSPRLLIAATLVASALAQTAGSIQGTALDAVGKPSSETLVRVIRLRPHALDQSIRADECSRSVHDSRTRAG